MEDDQFHAGGRLVEQYRPSAPAGGAASWRPITMDQHQGPVVTRPVGADQVQDSLTG